jgi:hypothetical protein
MPEMPWWWRPCNRDVSAARGRLWSVLRDLDVPIGTVVIEVTAEVLAEAMVPLARGLLS